MASLFHLIVKTTTSTGVEHYSQINSTQISEKDFSKLKKKDSIYFCYENVMYEGIIQELSSKFNLTYIWFKF